MIFQRIVPLFVCLLFFSFFLAAQSPLDVTMDKIDEILFRKMKVVDGKRVNRIQEWRRYAGQDKAAKGSDFGFNWLGLLANAKVKSDVTEAEWVISYADLRKPLLNKVTFVEGADTSLYFFAYKNARAVVEKRLNQSVWKTFFYYDKKERLIERKAFYLERVGKGDYKLQERVVFNYNKQDSLFGEMYYDYQTAGQMKQRKLVHEFDSTGTKKQTTTNFYLYKNGWKKGSSTQFYYNDDGQLIKEEERSTYEDRISQQKVYQYENGQLYSITHLIFLDWTNELPSMEEFKLYKNGQLIYRKLSNQEGLIMESNYQYDYFD